MDERDFDQLTASVKQAGAIKRGELKPARATRMDRNQPELIPEMKFAVEEAGDIVEAVADVIHSHTKEWIAGLIVFGSAVRGGFIPGCSDIDFQLFLEDDAIDSVGCLPLTTCLAIHRGLSKIDPRPFRYIQCTPTSVQQAADENLGPVPGTYRVVRGRLPVAEATAEQLVASARQALAALEPSPEFVRKGLLDHGDGRLERDVRLLCTKVWPVLFHVLTIHSNDPISAWQLPKDRACDALPEDLGLRRQFREFYGSVLMHYRQERSGPDTALDLIEKGVACLTSAQCWWDRLERSQRRS